MVMEEIPDQSVHLMVTSPPYFNAPFDYKGLFKNYDQYLGVLRRFAKETFRVLQEGRIAVLNIDDMLINGEKFPIVADAIKIFQEAGFRYRDNLLESIIIFQKGKFNYRSVPKEIREASKIDTKEFSNKKWYMTLWEMNNVLPGSPLEKDIAAFPYELPYRIIKLFSYKSETVLDPFVGSGTTMKAARDLGRNSIGIEIKKSLVPIIKEKLGFGDGQSDFLADQNDKLEIIYRKPGKYGPIS